MQRYSTMMRFGSAAAVLLAVAVTGSLYANNPADCVWALDADDTEPCDPSNATDPPGGCASDACSNTGPTTCRDTTTAWTDATIYDFAATGDDVQDGYEEKDCYDDVDCSHVDNPDTKCKQQNEFFWTCDGELLGSTCYTCSSNQETQTEESAKTKACPDE